MLEERCHGPRQAENDKASRGGAGVARRFQDRRQLVIVDGGNQRRGHHRDRNASLRQCLDGRQAIRGRRGTRLHDAMQVRVERRDREGHARRVELRQLTEIVDVARNELILRDQRHRIAELGQHREAAARDLQLPFHRLIWISDAADHDRLRLPRLLHQLLPQQLGRVLLHDDLRLEIEACGEAEVLVGGTGIAVDAAVLATAVRIETRIEADVGTVVVGDDRARRIAKIDRAPRRRLLVDVGVVVDDVLE